MIAYAITTWPLALTLPDAVDAKIALSSDRIFLATAWSVAGESAKNKLDDGKSKKNNHQTNDGIKQYFFGCFNFLLITARSHPNNTGIND